MTLSVHSRLFGYLRGNVVAFDVVVLLEVVHHLFVGVLDHHLVVLTRAHRTVSLHGVDEVEEAIVETVVVDC